jgi:hypothetical protein
MIFDCDHFVNNDTYGVFEYFYFWWLDGNGWLFGFIFIRPGRMDGSDVEGTLGGCSLHILYAKV